jgi:hypothetical protein
MTELGQTGDPRALIPGEPDVIEADAAALAQHARRTEQVGQGLRRVDVGRWEGAAGGGFAATWANEPVKWLKVADTISATTAALTGYAGTLRWAQDQAGGAIQLWNQGAAETSRALARYQASAAESATRDEPIGPFLDPGEPYRQQAREQLARAREQLQRAGEQAARAIHGSPVGMPGAGLRSGGTLNALVDAVTDGWTRTGQVARFGPKAGTTGSLSRGGKLAELKAYAQAGGATWAGAARTGPLSASGVGGFEIGAQAGVAASLGKKGLVGKAEVSAAARAALEGHLDYGRYGVYGRAAGSAGLEANASVKAGKDQVGLALGASAGLRGAVAGGAELGGIAVGATAEGWVGAGAKVDYGLERGKNGAYHLRATAGAALGVGGAVGFEVTVDPEQVARTARDAADALGSGAHLVSQVAEGFEHVVGDAAGQVGHSLGDVAGQVGHSLDDAADGIGRPVGGAAASVGRAVGDIARHLAPG